jgi:hypothetical protein
MAVVAVYGTHKGPELLRLRDRGKISSGHRDQRPSQVRRHITLHHADRHTVSRDLATDLFDAMGRINFASRLDLLHHRKDVTRFDQRHRQLAKVGKQVMPQPGLHLLLGAGRAAMRHHRQPRQCQPFKGVGRLLNLVCFGLAFKLARIDASRQSLTGLGAKLAGLSQRNFRINTKRQRLLLTESSVARTPVLVRLFDQQEHALPVGMLVSSCRPTMLDVPDKGVCQCHG